MYDDGDYEEGFYDEDNLYLEEYEDDELEEIELPSDEFIPEEQDEFLADITDESGESMVEWYNKFIKDGGH